MSSLMTSCLLLKSDLASVSVTNCILVTPNCAVISHIGTLCGAVAVCTVSFLNHL